MKCTTASGWWRLAVIALLLAAGTASARWDLERAQGIIGILALPEVLGGEACVPFVARDVLLFAAPDAPAPLGRIHVANPWNTPPDGGCDALVVAVALGAPDDERLPMLEYGYEMQGAIVRQREGAWFEIALTEGHAWVQVVDAAQFKPVEDLLLRSLAYLRPEGPVRLLRGSGSGETVWSAAGERDRNLPIEVLDFQYLAGRLWLQVKMLAVEPCEDAPTGVEPVTGWLPLHSADGMPALWFYSRGC